MADSPTRNGADSPGPTATPVMYMVKRVVTEFVRDGGTDQAAKLTYFMVLSIAPTLLALFSLATLLLSGIKDQIADLIKEAISSGAGGSGMEVGGAVDSTLDSLMGSATGGTVALIIGIADVTWVVGDLTFAGIALGTAAALALFHGMTALNRLTRAVQDPEHLEDVGAEPSQLG